MLTFDESYFQDETRDGFTVSAIMKHAWAAQLEVLDIVDQICKENRIQYFADFGTLLGAVRHKGFIPWDDDIDICMLQPDLKKFLEVVNQYRDEVTICSIYENPDYGHHPIRVINAKKLMLDRQFIKKYHGFPFPAGLDIFSVDYVPREKELEHEQVQMVKLIEEANLFKTWLEESTSSGEKYDIALKTYTDDLQKIQDGCHIKFSSENPTHQELLILLDEVCALYSEKDADYLSQIVGLALDWDYYIPKRDYAKEIRVPFENTTIPIPVGFKNILQQKYGKDYLIPKQGSSSHDYPFYEKYFENVKEVYHFNTLQEAKEYINKISVKYYLSSKELNPMPHLQLSSDFSKEELACLETAYEVIELCKKNKIMIFAVQETLKKAVNINCSKESFCKMELGILRKDYVPFLILLQEELSPWFQISSLYIKDKYYDVKTIVYPDENVGKREEFEQRFHGGGSSVRVEVIVMDYIPREKEKADMQMEIFKSLYNTAIAIPEEAQYGYEMEKIVEAWEKITGIKVNRFENIKKEFFRVSDEVSGWCNEKNADTVCNMVEYVLGNTKANNKELFCETIEVSYGGVSIPVPIGFEKILEIGQRQGED